MYIRSYIAIGALCLIPSVPGLGLAAFLLRDLAAAEPATVQGAPLEPHSAVAVQVKILHDADTISKCDLLLPFDVTLRNQSVRCFGYDAWEISRIRQTVTITDAELKKGKAAKAALEAQIAGGTLYLEDSGQRDPYGRLSGWLWIRTKDGKWISVANWMKAHGHCRTP